MKQPHRGVIYYNTGQSCLVRLLVSLHSLRRWYQGPVAVISEGDESHPICTRIAAAFNAELVPWDSEIPVGQNHAYLAKTRLNLVSPFETTVMLDSDTLVVGEVESLFSLAEENLFCVAQFANWKTSGKICSRRIRQWEDLLPDDLMPALQFGPAINIGVMAFRRDAPIFAEWREAVQKGRHLFIPDEISCQILLHRHAHHVLPSVWNCSCKYDDPGRPGVRVIHYHGRKHCRPGLPFHGDLWTQEFEVVCRENAAGIREWMPSGDRMLRRHLKSRKTSRVSKSHDPLAGKVGVDLSVPVYRTPLWSRRGHFDEAQADKYAEICREVAPQYALEIGFCTGRSAACVLHASASSLHRMISVDKDLGYRPPGRKMAHMLAERFPVFSVVEGESHAVLSPGFLRQHFPHGLDLVLIDGDHSYEGCAGDLAAVFPFLGPEGVLVVDDYGSGPPHGVAFEGVNRSVDEFLSQHLGEFSGQRWHHEGKGFCIIRRRPVLVNESSRNHLSLSNEIEPGPPTFVNKSSLVVKKVAPSTIANVK